MILSLLEQEISLGERLERVRRYAKRISYGPAKIFGLAVVVDDISDRYIWVKHNGKSFRIKREWIFGNARQEKKHVI